jgi:hypothetical protein
VYPQVAPNVRFRNAGEIWLRALGRHDDHEVTGGTTGIIDIPSFGTVTVWGMVIDFNSKLPNLYFALILMVAVVTTYMVGANLRETVLDVAGKTESPKRLFNALGETVQGK